MKQSVVRALKHSSIVILLLVIGSQYSYAQTEGQIIDKVVAVIGDQAIMLSDIEKQKVQLLRETNVLPKDIDCQILEEMMFQALLLHQADVDSIEIGESQVTQELDRRLAYFIGLFAGDIKKLEAEYGKSLAEIKEDFYDQIEDQLKSQQMQSEITSKVSLTPREIKEFFNNQETDSLPLIDAQVEFSHLVRYAVVSEDQKSEMKTRMLGWRDDISVGSVSFATKALFESEDPGSSAKGGDLGWVSRGTFVPEFESVAYSLPVGQISDPFESPFGMHMLEVLEKRGDQIHCRHILKKFKVASRALIEIRRKTDSIYDFIKDDSLTFRQAILKYSEDKDTKNSHGVVYNPQSGETKWNFNDIDPYTFGGIEDLGVGEISEPSLYEEQRTGKQAYRLIQLISRTEPHKANLKQDYQIIQKMAKREKEKEVVDAWVLRRIKGSFIRIDSDYKSCDFRFTWLDQAQ